MALLWFAIILVLGIVGNVTAARQNAFHEYPVWFYNVVWVIALRLTLPLEGLT